MNNIELSNQLERIKIDSSRLFINKEVDCSYCLIKKGRKWIFFFTERGERREEKTFKDEDSACNYALNFIKNMYLETDTKERLKNNPVLIRNCIEAINLLRNNDVIIDDGLLKKEISEIENKYNIVFPPDLREFYSYGLPVSKGFINWRNSDPEYIKTIKERLSWPYEGIIFDIKNNKFWIEEFGEEPTEIDEKIRKFSEYFKKVPKLIPIYGHRYIPIEPYEENNPIISVYQTDIIFYGENLFDYFKIEFGKKNYEVDYNKVKKIRFWSEVVE
ncbi:hypothetical protein [Haliovirga abyssi]|uniref:SMI1/KNR4 family protein n=1 Tax=Haliovirga abyssi TaxID=2996794 RepID=A0AAU9DU94_9FUSO|nr:hypothetical protein [Haliovirga abyssi]BDU49486.1 hypothetical protein HLVA_00550 [Haliovirga abyssi]